MILPPLVFLAVTYEWKMAADLSVSLHQSQYFASKVFETFHNVFSSNFLKNNLQFKAKVTFTLG